jgi:hypothetical protein
VRPTTTVGTARLDALLSEKKARVDLVRHHGSQVAPLINDLNQTIVLLVEAVDDEGVELGVGERLSNGRQRVSMGLDLVVELCGRGVELLAIIELATEGTSTGLLLRHEGAVKDCPCFMRHLGKDDESGNSRSERPLDGGEVRVVLPNPDTVRRVIDQVIHAVHQRRRARKRTVDVAE